MSEPEKLLNQTGVNEKKSALDVVKDGEKVVTAVSPRSFTLTMDDHTKVEVKAGIQELPESVATHWYAKAHGVSIYEPEKKPSAKPAK
jgi:hypothetical protein